MKKTSAAAATIALATALTAGGVAHADKNEPMVRADFSVTAGESTPVTNANGDLVMDQDGNPTFKSQTTYAPRIRTAAACFANKDGQKFTISINFLLAASVSDLGLHFDDKTTLEDGARQIMEKFPPAQADKAAAYIAEGWKSLATRHKFEEIATRTPSKEFLKDLTETFGKIADGKRLDPDVKSFEEETGITIGIAGMMPAGVTPGCAP